MLHTVDNLLDLDLSAPLRGEREGTRPASDGEGEVGIRALRQLEFPHLTPTLSAPKGGEGGSALGLQSSGAEVW